MSEGQIVLAVLGGWAAGALVAYLTLRYIEARRNDDIDDVMPLMCGLWPFTVACTVLWYVVLRPVGRAGRGLSALGERHRRDARERERIRAEVDRELLS